MGFEQIPEFKNKPIEPTKEKDGYILENGIWRKRTKEEDIELTKENNEEDKGTENEKTKEIDEKRRELDEKHAKLENKEFKTPEDIEEIARIEKEHKELSEQSKKIDEKKEKKEKETNTKKFPEFSDIEIPKDKTLVKALKDKIKEYDKKAKELTPEAIADYIYKAEILETLLANGKVNADELSKKIKEEHPSVFNEKTFYKAYSFIQDYVETGGKNLKRVTGVKIEKGGKGGKKKENLEKDNAWSKIEKVIQDPESILQSLIENPEKFTEVSEIFKDSIAKKKLKKLIGTKEYQALIKRIEKVTKEKGKIPEAVADAKEHIEKKESPWGTAFGAAGWGILLFLVLFILAELKGIDWLSGQATGKKKEKK